MPNVLKLPLKGCGATREEWLHFDMLLGLGADLLPVISNPDAAISPNSSMQSTGKTPSQYNNQRQAVGFSQWTGYEATTGDIEKWSREPDYGICLQTRKARALDVDVSDASEAAAIHSFITERFNLPMRYRANSPKFLLAFISEGEHFKKRFKTAHGMVEFLATGQQFIACGQHPSGSRYEWRDGLPDGLPTISTQEFEQLWDDLAQRFAVEAPTQSTSSIKQQKLADVFSTDPVAQYLVDKNLVKKAERDGRLHIACPWEDEHTSESGESSTTYWPAHTGGYALGHFKCLHAHCEHRSDAEFTNAIGYINADTLADFDAIGQTVSAQTQTEESDSQTLKAKFVVEPAHEFSLRPAPRWIVKDILPKAELAVLYGDSGSGKTFFALDLCAAIALGQEWRGKKVHQGKVVYVAAEGAGGFRNRLKAYSHQHQIELSDLPIGVIAAAPNMMEKNDAVEIAKAIVASGGADIVVLDTFAQVMPGANENSGEDVGKALAHCKGIHRATGALVLLVHHSGKDSSKGARGWSGLRAAADAEIEVMRSEDARAATVTKLKDGEDSASFGFRLHTVTVGLDLDGDEITSCVLEHNDGGRPSKRKEPKGKNERLAIRLLTELIDGDLSGDGVQVGEFIEAMVSNMLRGEGKQDQRRTLALRAVDSLVADGRVESTNGKLQFKEV